MKEANESKVLESSLSYNKTSTPDEVKRMIQRFEEDTNRRRLALKVKQEQKQLMEQREEESFFKPNTTQKRINKKEADSGKVSLSTLSDCSANFQEKLKETQEIKPLAQIWEEAEKRTEDKWITNKQPAKKLTRFARKAESTKSPSYKI